MFTRSGAGRTRAFRRHAKAGMLGVNISMAPVAVFPFSGWRGSFYGDLHANGEDGINFYTERKVVTSRWVWQAVTGPRPTGLTSNFHIAE